MAKPVCKDCGETRVTWQRSFKGNWYLKDDQGRPHFKHCVVKTAPVPTQPTQAEIDAANSPEVQADLVAEFQSQVDTCVRCYSIIGDTSIEQEQNGQLLKWCSLACASGSGGVRDIETVSAESALAHMQQLMDNTMSVEDIAVEQHIARVKPLIVADLMKAFNKPDAIKPNSQPRDVYRANTPTANPLPVKVQPRATQKPITSNSGQPVNIPCPKCRQPNKLTFQQLTSNQTCC